MSEKITITFPDENSKEVQKGISGLAIAEQISKSLAKEAIAGIATLELKSDEHALIDFVNHRDWPIRFFSSEQLAAIDVPNPSLVVFSAHACVCLYR